MTASPITRSAVSLRLVRAHVWRATIIWVAAHAFLGLATGQLDILGARGSVITALTASIIAYVDSRRRREIGFLGNLGVPWTILSGVAAVTVILLEIIAATILPAIRR